jgi:transcriptional regulator with XRE-family HTH domain
VSQSSPEPSASAVSALPTQKARGTQRLAELVRRRMNELGCTLQTVSARSGLSISTIWAIREGARGKRPRPTTIVKLAAGLQVPVEQLFAALDDDEDYAEHRHLHVYRQLDPLSRWAVDAFAARLLASEKSGELPDIDLRPPTVDLREPTGDDAERGGRRG